MLQSLTVTELTILSGVCSCTVLWAAWVTTSIFNQRSEIKALEKGNELVSKLIDVITGKRRHV